MLPEHPPSASGSIVSVVGRLERIPAATPEGLAPPLQRFVDHFGGISVTRVGSAAVLRVDGPLMNDPGWMWEGFGAITYTQIASSIDAQAAERGVAVICLDLHSPGGGVAGFADVQAAIRRAKAAGKRLVAYVHDLAASMAYWLAALCDEIVSSPLGQAGSVGVIAMVYDTSEAFAKAGVKPRPIASSPDKGAAFPGVPVTPEWEAMIQKTVDELYGLMVADVARGRRMTPEAVRGLRAGIFSAAEAYRLGLVDRLETPDAFTARVGATPLAPTPTTTHGTTTTTATSGGGKDRTMEELKDISLADLRAHRPDLVAAIEKEALARDEQARRDAAAAPATFAQLRALYGDNTAGLVAAQERGLTLDAARAAVAEDLRARLAASEARAAELVAKNADLEKRLGVKPGAEPVGDGAKPAGDPAPGAKHPFLAACEQLVAEKKAADLGAAMIAMARKDPAAHRSFIAAGHRANA